MDQELMTMINNLKAIAEQMTQMISGEAAPQSPEQQEGQPAPEGQSQEDNFMKKLLKVLKEEDEKGKPEEEGKPEFMKSDDEDADDKDKVEKDDMEDEGTNASDDAEERQEEGIPEATEENIKEVAKAIVAMLHKGKKAAPSKTVKKSQDGELTEVLKAIIDEIRVVKKAQENILEGIGLADQIRGQFGGESKPERKQIRGNDAIAKSLDDIKSLLGGSVAKAEEPKNFDLHKALTDNDGVALRSMLSMRNKKV